MELQPSFVFKVIGIAVLIAMANCGRIIFSELVNSEGYGPGTSWGHMKDTGKVVANCVDGLPNEGYLKVLEPLLTQMGTCEIWINQNNSEGSKADVFTTTFTSLSFNSKEANKKFLQEIRLTMQGKNWKDESITPAEGEDLYRLTYLLNLPDEKRVQVNFVDETGGFKVELSVIPKSVSK